MSMEITLDDSSPMFKYSGRWIRQHDTDDQINNYFERTYYSTNNENNFVSLTFNGTGITVYGSKRSNHGTFTSQIDNGEIKETNGFSSVPLFQQVLYTVDNLSSDQEHTLIFTNTPSRGSDMVVRNVFDIDYAVIKTATTGTVHSTIIDDASSLVRYTGDNWIRGTPSDDYYATTRMVSRDAGDIMEFNFTGTSIQIFGAVNFDHGNHSVIIDGVENPNNIFNGSFWTLKSQVTLFMANNLPDGPHTFSLTNLGKGGKGNMLDFDYALVNSTISDVGKTSVAEPTKTEVEDVDHISFSMVEPTSTHSLGASVKPASNSDSSNLNGNSGSTEKTSFSSTNIGAIVGGVVGGVIGIALIILLIIFLMKRRKGNKEHIEKYITTKESKLDLNGGEVEPYHDQIRGNTNGNGNDQNGYFAYSSLSPNGNDNSSSFGNITPGRNDQSFSPVPNSNPNPDRNQFQLQLPYLTSIPIPPGSNATSYPGSIYPSSTGDRSENNWPQGPPSTTFTHNTFGASGQRDHIASSTIDEEESIPQIQPQPPRNEKSRLNLNLVNPDINNGDREQDMGPYNPEDDHHHRVFQTLPPDYQQATQRRSSSENP